MNNLNILTKGNFCIIIFLFLFSFQDSFAQLTGTKTIPGDYATIAAAVADLNTQGVGAGGVTFNVAAGHTETLTDSLKLTATGTSSDQIVFQKSGGGANPLITARLGVTASSTSLTAYGDGIVIIEGGDYITFDGISLQDNPAAVGVEKMEFGYFIKKASGTDASKNVTIKNSTITLDKTTIYSFGIYVSNFDATGTSVDVTSTGGIHENIKIFNNNISNVYGGIQLRGFIDTAPFDFYDHNIEIGVDGANTITNYGGSSTTAYGFYAIYQDELTVANNTINGGAGTTTTLYGMFLSTGTNSSVDIYNNTVTIEGGGTTSTIYAINNSMGSVGTDNTVNIYNNIVENCTYPTATSGAMYHLYNLASAFNVNIYGNTVRNNSKPGTSGAMYLLYSSSTGVNGFANVYNNSIYGNSNTAATGDLFCLYTNEVTSSTKMVYNNTIYNNSGNDDVHGINSALGVLAHIYRNSIYDITSTTALTTSPYNSGITVGTGTNIYVYNNFISDLKAPNSAAVDAVRGISITSATANATRGVYFNTIFLNASSGGTNFGSSGIFHINSTTATSGTLDMRNNVVVNLSTPNGTGRTVAFRRSAQNANLNNYSEISNNNSFYAGTPGANNLIFFDGTNSDETMTAFQSRVTPRETLSFSENVPFVNSTTAPYNLHVNTAVATQTESGGTTVSSPIAITDDYDGNTRNASTPDVGADEFAGTGLDILPPSITYVPLPHTGSLANRTLVVNVTDASGVPTTSPGWPNLYWMKTGDIGWTAVTPSSVLGDDFTYNFGAGVSAGDVVSYYVVAQDLAGTPNVGSFPSAGAGGFTTNPPAASTPPTEPSTYNVTNTPLAGSYTVGFTAFRNLTGKNITFERIVSRVMKEVWVENSVTEKSETPVEPSGAFEMMEVEEINWIPMENGQPYSGDLYIKKNENPQLNFPDGIEGIYATITAAVADLNIRGVSGATTFLLDDASYLTETLPITIDINNEFMTTAVNNVTFKPNTGVTSLISGSSTASTSVFKLNGPGANYIVFDGSNSGGTSRNLTVENTSTSTSTAVFWVSSLGDGAGSMNNTFKNLIIKAGSNSVTSTFGIYAAGTTISTTGTGSDNDNLTIQNNEIMKSYRAVFIRGNATGFTNGLNITGNVIGSSDSVDYVTFRGVEITNAVEPVISSNTIFNMIIATSVSVAAIDIGLGVTDALISNNYIHTIESNSTGGWSAYGINISSGTGTSGVTIVNNMIAGMRTDGDGTSTTFNPYGIRITGGTGHKVYYNSVNLFGVFGVAANISAALIVTSTTVTDLDVRNNIFSNSTTGEAGTASYAVYGINGVTFGTINNNDYYVSGANAILGFLGADVTTLAGWQSATTQDANSVVSNPFFTSNLDLHVNTGLTPTSLESTGAVIPGFTTDFDGDVRPGPAGSVNGGATAPDIGADEFDGVPSVPMVYVSSTVSQDNTGLILANTTDNEIIALQVVTTGEDNALVLENIDFTTTGTTNLADITNAKVWYTGTSPVFATSLQFGSTLAVPTASFSVTGSQALSQGTNYFWLTFDLPGTATNGNIVDAQGPGFDLSSIHYVPTVTNPVGSRTIVGSLSGAYDVGAGQDFNTITDAVNALNIVGVSGAVTFNLTDSDYSSGETFPININEVAGASAVNTITFKPASGVNATINGSSSGSLIKLNGADFITFDGSNNGTSSRNLTVQNNSTASSTSVIWVSSLGTGTGAENNTVKNCIIIGGSGTVTSQFGVYAAGTTVSTTGTGAHNNNLTLLNNSISKAYYGVYARGVASTGILENLNISNNLIGSELESEYIGFRGIQVFAANNSLLEGNTVFNIINTATNMRGIELGAGFVNSVVTRNKIYEINYTATSFSAGKGITLETGDAAANVTVSNNLIYGLKGHGSTTVANNSWGIMMINGGGYDIYYNTVVLSDDRSSTSSTDLHGCVYVATTVTDVDLVNNIMLTTAAAGHTGGNGKTYGLYSLAANTAYTTINYNYYYAEGVNRFPAFLGGDLTTLTEIQTAFGGNLNSAVADPILNSFTNLRPQTASPVLGAGTPIAGITIDYAGVTRNATNPSIGGYETGADAIGPIITYTPLPNSNSTANRILSDVIITDLSGINVTGFKPRIYFKKLTDANVFGGNASTDNGWKWTETAQISSPFSFTINNSIIFGGSVSQNDSIQYFVVAQDLASVPNVNSNPSAGFVGTSVSNITSAPTTPYIYKIVAAALAGDYTVGLNLFNKVNNRNLVMEKRSRKVMIEIPIEETVQVAYPRHEETGFDTKVNDVESESPKLNIEADDVSKKQIVQDISKISALNIDADETPLHKPVFETIVRYETVEVDEEYTILVENGLPFIWKPYSERQFDGFEDGVYPTIAAAAADVAERGVSGPVNFILVDASYTETYPVVLGESFGTSSTNLITFKPQTGLAVTISATSPVTAMFHLNGADYYVFDGLNSGGSSLTLTNTSTTVPVFLIENGASNNTLKNLSFNTQYTSTVNGVINILSTNSTGNSNNTIMNNNFNDNGGSRAAVYINSTGSAVNPNEMMTITGNNFKNFTSAGVRGTTGTGSGWNITSNHFFWNLSASTLLTPINFIPGAVSGGNTISGNFIGGSAPNAGDTAMVVTSNSSFTGIAVDVDTTDGSVISENVVKNINKTGTGSHTFIGINVIDGNVDVTDNMVGEPSTANSILVAGTSTTTGIRYDGTNYTNPFTVSGNTIANMNASGTGTAVRVRGITYDDAIGSVTYSNNVIHNLSTMSSGTGVGAGSQAAVGMHIFGDYGTPPVITGNTIYNISADNTGAFATTAAGIMATDFSGVLNANRIYNIFNASTGSTAVTPPIAAGLFFRFTSNPVVINNMISIGSGQDNGVSYFGIINLAGSTNSLNIHNNTVVVSGTVTSGGLNSAAFQRGYDTEVATATITMKNNILDNQRSGGTGKHYAISNISSTVGWDANGSNYNILNSSSAATVGNWLGTDQTFTDWKTSSGGDANSYSGETVVYTDIPTADLHLNMGTNETVLESGATVIAGLDFDFDGDVRPGPAGSVNGGATAPDIGADEFDGVPSATSTFQLTVNVGNGWNMVSIPGLHPTNQQVLTWWPGKDPGANVFKYSGGYQSVTDAAPSEGYWMKNAGAQTYNTGDEWPAGGINIVSHNNIPGAQGWNLIGGYEYNAQVSGITTNPPGLVEGSVFGYSGGYQAATELLPGYGYWIKLSAAGDIILPPPSFKGTAKIVTIGEDWGKIIVTDNSGRNYTLYSVEGEVDLNAYELPPLPPSGMFDVRYGSGRYAEDLNKTQQIDMSGMEYPVKVRAEGVGVRLQDVTGRAVNERLKAGEEVVISQNINKLNVTKDIIPDTYSLEQNYPNPFNPSTIIEFGIPEDAKSVTLTIYNALGEKVAELINGSYEAGYYKYQWNAVSFASGLYIYELRTEKFVSIKKMMLLK
jgi:hypothetical protein